MSPIFPPAGRWESAKVETESATATAEPPARVEVKAGTLVLYSDEKPIRLDLHRETLEGAKDHAPPSPADKAKGWGVKITYAAGMVLILGGGVLAWMTHKLSALMVSGGGAVLMLFGGFLGSPWALPVTIGLVALGGGLWLAWQILEKRGVIKEGAG